MLSAHFSASKKHFPKIAMALRRAAAAALTVGSCTTVHDAHRSARLLRSDYKAFPSDLTLLNIWAFRVPWVSTTMGLIYVRFLKWYN